MSSQLSVASMIRPATGAHSCCTAEAPAIPGILRPSVSRSAARIIIFEGTQPQYGHSPPTSLSSTPATTRPASASWPAAYSPPGPMPMTTTSTSCSLTGPPGAGACSRAAKPRHQGQESTRGDGAGGRETARATGTTRSRLVRQLHEDNGACGGGRGGYLELTSITFDDQIGQPVIRPDRSS